MIQKIPNVDILLWNSFMGKAYSVSDCFMENGIGILHRACRDSGIDVVVEDPANIGFYTSFTKNDLVWKLSEISMKLFSRGINEDIASLKKEWDTLQKELDIVIQEKMEKYLHELALYVRNNNVKVLGIKTWLGNRFVYSEKLAQKVAELNPQTVIIAGGPQVNQYKSHALENSPFDFCIDIEGEITLTKIVSLVKEMYAKGCGKKDAVEKITALAEEGMLDNLIYRKNDHTVSTTPVKRVPLNRKILPFYKKGEDKIKIAVINESSGCYYGKCSFCTHPNITGKYQVRDVGITLEEIKTTIRENGIGLFRFAGSITPVALAKKIADALLGEGLQIEYSMFIRAENKAKERMGELVDAYEQIIRSGLRAVFLGVEAANEEILVKSMNKGKSVQDIYFTIKALKQASYNQKIHVDVGTSFIYPCPLPIASRITHDQVLEENLHFLRTLKKENYSPDSVLITPGVPLPLTPWHQEASSFGFHLPDNYVETLIRYEYELAKDPITWPDLHISSGGIDFKDMLKMAGVMESKVKEMGYLVNISDEHCLAARSAGFNGRAGLEEFKRRSDLALLTTDYSFFTKAFKDINAYSQRIASKNVS